MADTSTANPLSEPGDPQAEYRTVEPWAVGGVLLGLLSAVAMLGGILWLVAALGVVANLVALRAFDANVTATAAGQRSWAWPCP